MRYSKIIGTGSYLPEKIVTNHDLEKKLDTSHEWIVQRTGIHQRHQAAEHENVASMSVEAAKRALKAANIPADKIGLIIVATCTNDNIFPSAAGDIQKAIGAPECPAFDLSAACAGFVYALSFVDSYIKTGQCDYAIIVGCEAMSRVVDQEDRSIAVLFGDGAGAVVLGPSDEPGIIGSKLHTNAHHGDILSLKHLYPSSKEIKEGASLDNYYVHMDGREVFKVAVAKLDSMVENILEENGFQKSDLTWLVPHQANYRIIKAVAKRLELSEDQVILTVGEHANTSAASIPLALDYGVANNKINEGDLLLLESFGGGLSWGAALIRY